MFDIGFTEIIIICLVGLVVIGPKRLPEALRAGAMWMGRGKRMLGNVRRDIENEIGIDEIRRDLRNEQIMAEIKAENLEEQQPTNSYLDSANKNGQPPKNSPGDAASSASTDTDPHNAKQSDKNP
jgi:sec-independent protein translocase protein TatB